MRRGLSAVLASDLAGAPALYAQSVDSFNGAFAVQASHVLEGYFAERNGQLEIRAAVLDVGTNKTVQSLAVEGPVAQGAIPLVNKLAKELSPAARSFPSASETAFHAYGEAISAGDRASALRELESATKEDPRFELAYLDWAKVLLGEGDRTGALQVVEAAKRSQPDAVDAVQLDYLAAAARGDATAREKALESLTRLTPADAKSFHDLGDEQLAQRKFPDAVKNYEAASRLDPVEPQIWNQLGYAQAFAGDLNGARSALEHYRQLVPPENVNPLDSLGEVSFYLGDFAAAEKYFVQADQKDRPEFGGADLLKAAEARLMAGDLSGSDSLFQKYVGVIEGRDRGRAGYVVAQWQFLTGRRKAAMASLEKLIGSFQGDGRALALNQLSIWKLETGDANAAADLAVRAEKEAVSPAARNISALCAAISKPPVGPSGSRLADAYALLFARKYAEATPLLELLYREMDPHADGQIRTLLAWDYVETNRAGDAAKLIGTYPLPLSSGEALFASLAFPRYLFVRGVVLQQQGKRAEAKAAYELFLKYAGDVPDIFGDEATARKNLSTL